MAVSGKYGLVTYGAGPTTLCADNWTLDHSPDDVDTSNFCAATTAESGHTAGKDSVSGPSSFSVTISGPVLQNTSSGALVTTWPTKGSQVNIKLGNSQATTITADTYFISRNFRVKSIEKSLSVSGRYEYTLQAESCV